MSKIDIKTLADRVLVEPSDEELDQFSGLNLDYFQIYGNLDSKKIEKIKKKYILSLIHI